MKNKFNLNEEIICDYKVTKKMKKVWKIELELLSEFQRVCKKYGLKYFISGGSLLGAVRHNGFIPWDDDIDIGMLRDDYNKLLKIAPKEFKNEIFFQTPYTDKLFRGHAQLRNSNTSAISYSEIYMDHNQGIFIDIFPFDEYPKRKICRQLHKKRIDFIARIFLSYLYSQKKSFKSKLFYSFSKFIIGLFGFEKFYNHYERVCSMYNGKGSRKIYALSFMYCYDKFAYDVSLFKNYIEHKFEYLDVMIPLEYDSLLKQRYGDYMKFEKGASLHGNIHFDPDVDYKKTITKLRNKK